MALDKNADDHREYWAEYTEVQKTKHTVLRTYLGGWFPILASFSGRVLYIESHAGRGTHDSGQIGSPLVALDVLLKHSHRDRIIGKCEVHFVFIERDEQNMQSLRTAVEHLSVPPAVVPEYYCKDYADCISAGLDKLDSRAESMAPSFVFVDPYGFRLPMNLLKRLAERPRVEMLVTLMTRYIDMAVFRDDQSANLDLLFGTDSWRNLRGIGEPPQRQKAMVELFAGQLQAQYMSWLELRGEHREPKYVLLHTSNHRRGRELMKDTLWKVTPNGSFVMREARSPEQYTLITEDPDLSPLEHDLLADFAARDVPYEELCDWLLPRRWRETHLKQVLRAMRKCGLVTAAGYGERFAFDRKPVFTFPPRGEANG